MFNRLFMVRVRAAERALEAGRLDEAFRLATAPDIRAHRRGEAILNRLADRFMERARAHLEQERFSEALHDLSKAEAGGVKTDAIAELRRNVQTVAEEVSRLDRSRRRRLELARQHVQEGSLSRGRRALADARADDDAARRLAGEIEQRQRRAADGFDEVYQMLKKDQLHAAVERFARIKPLDPHASKAVALESAICTRIVDEAMAALRAGRIRRAADELDLLGALGTSLPKRRDAEERIDLVARASSALASADYEGARRHMLRLKQIMPDVDWIDRAADELDRLDNLLTSLHSGPLGERANPPAGVATRHVKDAAVTARQGKEPAVTATGRTGRAPAPIRGARKGRGRGDRKERLDETVMLVDRRRPPAATVPDRFLVLVDGGGSYLLLRNDRVVIGRAMARHPADVPIVSDLAERHAEISCVQDDYFLFSSRDIEVDSRPTRHQLLRDGHRVVLAGNARFTFRLPHRQSASAVLELSSATKMPNDVRRVVLFRRTAMIGAGPHAHMTCHSAGVGLVLFERAGQLWIRPQRSPDARMDVDTEARPVRIGEHVELSNVSLVLEPWTTAPAGPSFT